MPNSLKKILDRCSCKSSCQIEKDIIELKNFFKELSLDELLHLKEYMEKKNGVLSAIV